MIGKPATDSDRGTIPKLAPFTDLRWSGDEAEVEVDGSFYRLRAVDGVSIDQLATFSKETYEGQWKKRISEDLVQVMTALGRPPGQTVVLTLESLGEGREALEKEATMTREKRQRVWLANVARAHG
jgi:hypothetical protein